MYRGIWIVSVASLLLMGVGCRPPVDNTLLNTTPLSEKPAITSASMKLTSPAFEHNQAIPAKYSCDGNDVNPPLVIADVPAEAKSLVLIVDDPDAPAGTWVHWVVWNIRPDTKKIEESSVPSEAEQGVTSFGEVGWGGPCPPDREHRYFFRLYALDTKLNLPPQANRAQADQAMSGHILDQAELVGRYQRPGM